MRELQLSTTVPLSTARIMIKEILIYLSVKLLLTVCIDFTKEFIHSEQFLQNICNIYLQ